jgi:hypothetical protein
MSPKKALPSPWKEFFEEIDSVLTVPVTVYCMGGFVLTRAVGIVWLPSFTNLTRAICA